MQNNIFIISSTVNGLPLVDLVCFEVIKAGYGAAARYEAQYALASNETVLSELLLGSSKPTISYNIAGQSLTNELMFTGVIDNIRFDITEGLATLSGRDLAALLIDSESPEAFMNHSASQIAILVAQRHGLVPIVTPTQKLIGQYYEIDHARSALALGSKLTTEWNLLTSLAQLEEFELYVEGNTLYFGPQLKLVGVPLSLSAFNELVFDVSTSLPTCTNVNSWNVKDKLVYFGKSGTGLTTSIIKPNFSAEQAQIYAQTHLSALQKQAVMLHGIMPVNLALDVRSEINLFGPIPNLNRSYTISKIIRRFSASKGQKQIVWATSALA